MRWHEKLASRLLLPIVGAALLSLAASLFLAYGKEKDRLVQRVRLETERISKVIRASLHQEMLEGKRDSIQATLEMIQEQMGRGATSLVNAEGHVVFSSDARLRGTTLSKEDRACKICHRDVGVAHTAPTVVVESDAGDTVFRSVTPILNSKECYDCHEPKQRVLGMLLIDKDISADLAAMGDVQRALLGIGGITIIVLVGLVFLAIHLLVQKPMRTVVQGAQRLRDGDFGTVIPAEGTGEICELARAFNDMAGGIREYVGEIEQKRFELSTLYTMVQKLSRTIETRELREIILDLIVETFPDVTSSVMVVRLGHEGAIEFSTRSVENDASEPPGPSETPVLDWQQVVGPDLARRWLLGELTDLTFRNNGAEIVVPISIERRILGLLRVSKREGKSFSKPEEQLVQALRSHIAIALENARLYAEATTDELTQAHTLRYFQGVLGTLFARHERYGQRFALAILDLDGFKTVNDRLGHLAGDEALKTLVRIVKDAIRSVDVVCRYGGDEFVVVLPENGLKGALAVAERIRSRVEATTFEADGASFHLTTSVGVAALPTHASTVRELVKVADEALYKAKDAGKNRVVAADVTQPEKGDSSESQ